MKATLLVLLACNNPDKPITIGEEVVESFIDADGDGYGAEEDCDDYDGLVHPGGEEICDAVDNDCDGQIDEGVNNRFYLDGDGDGFGISAEMIEACDAPEGYVPNDNDCDDENELVYPSAPELCDDLDNDCNGEIDDGTSGVWYADLDQDGFGDTTTQRVGCRPDSSWVQIDDDCDDFDALVNPAADELCDDRDNDCDGEIDEGVLLSYYFDLDQDGFGDPNAITQSCSPTETMVTNGLDCDDINPQVNPNATELCSDEIDNNCDGAVDDDTSVDAILWYQDADQDGFGGLGTTTYSCERPSGYADNSLDCNDYNNSQYPDAPEICNEIDDDCDGIVDEDATNGSSVYYLDLDQDGYGDPNQPFPSCSSQSGLVENADDCLDTDGTVYPNAPELCDGQVNSCQGSLPLEETDSDGDGYVACELDVNGWDGSSPVAGGGDCDESDPQINPAAEERCADAVDNNCDGNINEDTAVDATLWYQDADQDGFGDLDTTTYSCERPDGYTDDSSDCNDFNERQYPNAMEICNSLDDDCDGLVDEDIAQDAGPFYRDLDGDGYGDPSEAFDDCLSQPNLVDNADDCLDTDGSVYLDAPEICDGQVNACAGSLPPEETDPDGDGYVACEVDTDGWDGEDPILGGGDCDESSAEINPSAIEICADTLDNNCDGNINEDSAVDALLWYRDADQDGFGDQDTTTYSCVLPEGYTDDASDCNDSNDLQYPNAVEVCNSLDDDCDGQIDEGVSQGGGPYYLDLDQDGYGDPSQPISSCSSQPGLVDNADDCLDTDDTVYPNAPELCDGQVNACGGSLPLEETDPDGDGYVACELDVNGWDGDESVSGGGDCDESSAEISPAAEERCSDAVDNNCDGSINEDTAIDTTLWYRDADQDGFGDLDTTTYSCEMPDGYTDNASDCNDFNELQYPNAPEICNSLDDDCDGAIDENITNGSSVYYLDMDQDGYGDPSQPFSSCSAQPNLVDNADDCLDTDDTVYPNAPELCDGQVNACEGELPPEETDPDGDGYVACELDVNGWDGEEPISGGGDCDESSAEINPSATELCADTVDNNCDGNINEDSAIDALLWYRDADQDGFGDLNTTTYSCETPDGYTDDSSDCNDYNDLQYPNAQEYCNSADDNCDGQIDEGSPIGSITYYRDLDQDGYGDPDNTVAACSLPAGLVSNPNDCLDTDATVYFNAPELCDGLINSCAGQLPSDEADADGDGYIVCSIDSGGWDGEEPPLGEQDCNDFDDTVYPGAPDRCDGQVNSCQGSLHINETDQDGDGYISCTLDPGGWDGTGLVFGGDDCDDDDDLTHPYAGSQEENPEECMTDRDGDGFGTTEPSGTAVPGTDCTDDDASLSPISGLCPRGESCYDVLQRNPGVPSDNYIIDPDGAGGIDPFQVYCDMTTDGGGWTEIAYASDLQLSQYFSTGDDWYWLPFDFGYTLTDPQIEAIQAVSLEGYQEYVGLCEHVLHYYYWLEGNYDYAFGFEFFNGAQIAGGYETATSPLVSVLQDGCQWNGGEGGSVSWATIFAFDTPQVPLRNVRCRDCGDGFQGTTHGNTEMFGSPLTNHPAWLR